MKNHQNIVFIGMRGSGKTTLGKMLAKELAYSFLDTDQEIEENTGISIKEMVQKKGWEYFRAEERKLIQEIREIANTIISTGGGIILNPENIADLKENGVLIYLKTPIEIIKERLKNNSNRPALTGDDPLSELDQVYNQRKKIYEQNADFIYEKNEVAFSEKDIEDIIRILNSNF